MRYQNGHTRQSCLILEDGQGLLQTRPVPVTEKTPRCGSITKACYCAWEGVTLGLSVITENPREII